MNKIIEYLKQGLKPVKTKPFVKKRRKATNHAKDCGCYFCRVSQ